MTRFVYRYTWTWSLLTERPVLPFPGVGLVRMPPQPARFRAEVQDRWLARQQIGLQHCQIQSKMEVHYHPVGAGPQEDDPLPGRDGPNQGAEPGQ